MFGRNFTGCVHPCNCGHEKEAAQKNQRLHDKRRIRAKNEQKSTHRLSESSGRRRFLSSGAFRSRFPFGSGFCQTEKSQNSPTKKVQEIKKNPTKIARFQLDLVGVTGFEPAASWSRTKHSTGLSHTPIAYILYHNYLGLSIAFVKKFTFPCAAVDTIYRFHPPQSYPT